MCARARAKGWLCWNERNCCSSPRELNKASDEPGKVFWGCFFRSSGGGGGRHTGIRFGFLSAKAQFDIRVLVSLHSKKFEGIWCIGSGHAARTVVWFAMYCDWCVAVLFNIPILILHSFFFFSQKQEQLEGFLPAEAATGQAALGPGPWQLQADADLERGLHQSQHGSRRPEHYYKPHHNHYKRCCGRRRTRRIPGGDHHRLAEV